MYKTDRSETDLMMNGENFESREDGAYVEEADNTDRVIRFTLCSERLPDKSGEYACIAENGVMFDMPFSTAHKAFNVCDDSESLETAIPVMAWAEIPEWVKAEIVTHENS